MDFLNRTVVQLRDLFASMTPAARVTSAMLLGVIVVSLGYLFQGYTSGSKEYLFNGELLQGRDANAIEAALASHKLSGWERHGGRILVPRGNKAEYLAAIADSGALPANFDKLLEESLDLGPFVSEPTRQARTKAARERQLSMIVRMMEGVEDAQVLYDIREDKGFKQGGSTATVSVLPVSGQALTPQRMKVIRAAVAGAIFGMAPKDVTIVDLGNGGHFGAGGEAMAPENFDDPYFQTRTSYEQMMEARIVDLLHDIPGVRVKVTAELSPTLSAEIQARKSEGDPAIVRQTNETLETLNTQIDNRERPGLFSQGPQRTRGEQSVARNESTQNNSATETENFVPTTVENRREAGLLPERVRAAIAIPSDFIERVWRAQHRDAAPDTRPASTELTLIEKDYQTKVEGLVAPLFPQKVGDNPFPNVTVTVFQSLTPDKLEPPSLATEGLAWASRNSGSLIMAALAVVALLMLRSIMKSIPPAETNVILSAAQAQAGAGFAAGSGPAIYSDAAADDDGSDAPGERSAGSSPRRAAGGDRGRPRLKLKKGASMKDDLTDIVREDPDAAAAILRSWIGNAG